MNILFLTSEASPFAKSGGLGDVAGALPKELSRDKANRVCVMMPYYSFIKSNPPEYTEYIGSLYVPLSWRNAYAGVFKKVVSGDGYEVEYYFIDNDYYFYRNSMYGEPDDGERFAFFSKACLECLGLVGFCPDIVHCNDWQTGFVPLFLKAHYSHIDMYRRIRTVFTIHNIEYQGKADPDFLTDVLGVSESYRDVCTFDGLINSMKTAICLCDSLTTVSETYSHEIRYKYFANGLESVINDNSYKLTGVVNGIDMGIYNPESDPDIEESFSAGSPMGKERCKDALRRRLSLPFSDVPIVAMVTRLVNHKGLELIKGVANELSDIDMQFVIVGTGDSEYEDMFRTMESSRPDRVRGCITFDHQLAKEVYAGADFLLMPSKCEPCGLSQLIAMRYGTVPIVRETGGLVDTVPPFNPETNEGMGITFKVFNAHDMLGAVRRACDIYRQKESLNILRQNIMLRDSSWAVSASRYMEIYRGEI